jgi:hypothetical protein
MHQLATTVVRSPFEMETAIFATTAVIAWVAAKLEQQRWVSSKKARLDKVELFYFLK